MYIHKHLDLFAHFIAVNLVNSAVLGDHRRCYVFPTHVMAGP